MSGLAQGFVRGISDAASQAADKKYESEQAQKKSEWGLYSKVAFDNRSVADGGPTDEQRKYAMDQIGKRGGKDVKQGLQKFSSFRSLIDTITGKGGAHQTQPGAAPQQGAQPQARGPLPAPTPPQGHQPATQGQSGGDDPHAPPVQDFKKEVPQASAPQQGGPLAAPHRPGPPPAATEAQIEGSKDAASKSETKRRLAATEAEQEFYTKQGKDKFGLSGRDLAEWVGSQGKKIPPVAVVHMKPVRVEMKDGQTVPAMVSTDGKYFSLDGNQIEGDQIRGEAKKESSAAARFDGNFVTREQAKEQQEKMHAKFINALNDEEIKADEIPDGMVLQPAGVGGKFKFLLVNEKLAKLIADNKVIVAGKEHLKDAATDGVVQGQARVGTDRETSPVGIGGTHSVSNPVAPPIANNKPHGTAPAGQPQSVSPAADQPKRGPLNPPAGAKSDASKPDDASDPILPGISTAQYTKAAQTFAPVAAAFTEMFGDPRQPGLHPLESYAEFANDPAAKKRIGHAIEMTKRGFGDNLGGANVGASAGPFHMSAGGFGDWVQNQFKLPSALSDQRVQMAMDSVDQLKSDREKEAYNSVMASMSNMAGLRSISRQSAAMGSIKLIENELPRLYNSRNERDFYDALQRIGGSISTFMTTPGLFPRVNVNGKVIRAGVSPEMEKRIASLTSDLQAKKDAADRKGKSSGRGPLADPSGKTPKKYRHEADGPGGQSIGSDDGKTWYYLDSGKPYKAAA